LDARFEALASRPLPTLEFAEPHPGFIRERKDRSNVLRQYRPELSVLFTLQETLSRRRLLEHDFRKIGRALNLLCREPEHLPQRSQ
jgi:hypothetical protein